MVKVVYTGPGNYHLRMGYTNKVYAFTQENNFTQDLDRDTVYLAIREEQSGEYIKIEWDPKAIPRQKYKDPSVMSLGDMKPEETKQETTIENPSGEDTVIDTDKITNDVLGMKPEDIEDLWAWIPDTEETTPETTEAIEDESIPEAGPSTIVAEVQTEVETKSTLS